MPASRERVPAGDLLLNGRPEALLLGGLVLRHGADQRASERPALLPQLRGRLSGSADQVLHPVQHLLHLAVGSPEHLEHITRPGWAGTNSL